MHHHQKHAFPCRTALIRWTIFSLLTIIHPSAAQLIVSELYRDPPGKEDTLGGGKSHEFIELTNLGPDSIALDGLYITNGIEADSVVPVHGIIPGHEQCRYDARTIAPGATALLLDPDYRTAVEKNSRFRFVLPDGVTLLFCGDNEFGGNGLAADHGVMIYRGTRSRIDTILTTAADAPPLLQHPTADRIVLSEPVNREGFSVFATSVLSGAAVYLRSSDSISPGRFAPLHDRWYAEWRLGTFDPVSTTVACSLAVLTVAGTPPQQLTWKLRSTDAEKSTTRQSGTVTFSGRLARLSLQLPADGTSLGFLLDTANLPWDIDLSTAWVPASALRITEIFPKKTSAEPEWFEIMNNSTTRINLNGWRFSAGDDTVTITDISHHLDPGHFAVVTRDDRQLRNRYRWLSAVITPPSWVSLGDTRDTITLIDPRGMPHEKVCYDAHWFDDWPYLSLERNGNDDGCSRLSWVVAQRPSPEKPNDALYWRNSTKPSMEFGPVPFIISRNNGTNRLTISLSLPAAATAVIDIYAFNGRRIRRIAPVTTGTVTWDGGGESGPAPPGPFFVVAEITQNNTTSTLRKKGILWRK